MNMNESIDCAADEVSQCSADTGSFMMDVLRSHLISHLGQDLTVIESNAQLGLSESTVHHTSTLWCTHSPFGLYFAGQGEGQV